MKINNYTTTILLVVLALCLFLVLPSCGDPEIEYFIDEETKSYCYFENGASYIYKDSISGTIDSIKISSNWHRPNYANDYYETYITDITDWNELVIGTATVEVTMFPDFPSFGYINFSNTIIITRAVFNSRDIGIEENSGSSIGVLCDIYSHYQIENNDFYDIKKFKTQSNSNCYYSYWAKNVGLIRYEAYDLNDSLFKTINLIEYEINN
ncbi:MAG: hypothetical protein PHS54_04025 [Clostridia bacterium]|nr:hypothetical protein [Clostridia bacterium]